MSLGELEAFPPPWGGRPSVPPMRPIEGLRPTGGCRSGSLRAQTSRGETTWGASHGAIWAFRIVHRMYPCAPRLLAPKVMSEKGLVCRRPYRETCEALYFHRGQCCSTTQSNKQLQRPPQGGHNAIQSTVWRPRICLNGRGRIFGGAHARFSAADRVIRVVLAVRAG